jgi:hypothetical protein
MYRIFIFTHGNYVMYNIHRLNIFIIYRDFTSIRIIIRHIVQRTYALNSKYMSTVY